MPEEVISVRGAREHNLKNIDIDIPRNQLIVITGISGSGKSSLAFDTIYAEGQRRYIESLSAYARQFLGMLEKPDCDKITGLSPAIAIEQRTSARNPRSTVGTVTEIHDYLRLLFARIGIPHCPKCAKPITSQTTDQIVDALLAEPAGTSLVILAPLVRGRRGEYREQLAAAKRRGYIRCRIDGTIYELEQAPTLEKYRKHDIELVVDRVNVSAENRKRIADSVELAIKEGNGLCLVQVGKADKTDGGTERLFSTLLACPDCGFSFSEVSPRLFSFNSPQGACPTCHGLGTRMEIDPDRLTTNPELSILDGAVAPWGVVRERGEWLNAKLQGLSRKYRFRLTTPWRDLPTEVRQMLLYGTEEDVKFHYSNEEWEWSWEDRFEGVIPWLLRTHKETESESRRQWVEQFMSVLPCPDCKGTRLRPEALAVRIAGENIATVAAMSVRTAKSWFDGLQLGKREETIAKDILKELHRRLGFLATVGLDYLTLDRAADTLGGGEAQRVRLATQIGSGLVGVVYVLDEPSIGLHPRDNQRLLRTLLDLRDLGNTVIVVEHDAETILAADHVIDLGPGAGAAGGQVVCTGPPQEIVNCTQSLTGQYLSGARRIAVPSQRRTPTASRITLVGCRENNLKNITVDFPLGLFICVTGVSGSGKSTLVLDILHRALARRLYQSSARPGAHDRILGINLIDKVVSIDQSPIGRTPRSNPVTYTDAFTPIREIFAHSKEARLRGYRPGRFSFNVAGGRCEACGGNGINRVEMHFLPDVYVTCDVCKGKRYNRETLDVRYKGKNIAEVLEMSVDEAYDFFQNVPSVESRLRLLRDVGLGYIRLGQPAPTLSGGEAQRIKLARELAKIATGRTVYLLDEPTTGLHFEDVRLLLGVLDRLVERHNTVIVIEHNLEIIKCADWIIDLGPEGGDAGGTVVVAGTPEQVAACPNSYTGRFLAPLLKR